MSTLKNNNMRVKFIIVSITILVDLFFITGCDRKDLFIQELETAEQNIIKQKNFATDDIKSTTSLVTQKYFPIGMKKSDLLKVLDEFYEKGYEILELNYEGTRLWPNKQFRSYTNVNRQNKYPVGTEGYVLKKKYNTANLLITQTALISIKLDNNKIVIESNSRINTNSI